jgi:hypothetical protein
MHAQVIKGSTTKKNSPLAWQDQASKDWAATLQRHALFGQINAIAAGLPGNWYKHPKQSPEPRWTPWVPFRIEDKLCFK